jgi:preprotein translocase subunit SecY
MFQTIANTFANCFKIPELKSRIWFTLLLLAICRLIALIPVPGLDGQALSDYFELQASQEEGPGVLGFYSMFTGGALERCAVGALGIMPYISATIIVQLLTAVYGPWGKLAREEGGRTKLIQIGRYLTIILCLGQGFVMALGWENASSVFQGFEGRLVLYPDTGWLIWWYRIQTTLLLTAGTALLMWLGEQITDRGIGNGVSLVITIGILASLPGAAQGVMDMFFPAEGVEGKGFLHGVALVLMFVAVVAGTVAVTQTQRKIPVQYAQRTVGRKVYQGGTSYLPLRLNLPGVMPIIFAQAILMFPEKIFLFLGRVLRGEGDSAAGFSLALGKMLERLGIMFSQDSWFYITVYALMILFFSYFWTATQFNEIQIADDLKKMGGYVPGVRPGKETTDFLHRTMSRVTLAGAIFLVIIAVIPILLFRTWGVPFAVAQFFGGTSLLIAVGVMLDTMRQMESHLLMRHYDGFLKKGRIKGRF